MEQYRQVKPELVVAVDLTPMAPGGSPGGAKVLALELISRIRGLAPAVEFLLLTSSANDHEVGALLGDGCERIIMPDASMWSRKILDLGSRLVSARSLQHLRRRFNDVADALVVSNRRLMRERNPYAGSVSNLHNRRLDVLLCPFTTPLYVDLGIPIMSIFYDLQHIECPQFFTAKEITGRNIQIEWMKHWADVVVCISEHSRKTLVDRCHYPSNRTRVIPVGIHDRLRRPSFDAVAAVKHRFNLRRPYVLYPANGWPHKNHRRLLAAFELLHRRTPWLELDLVFTGEFRVGREDLSDLTASLGLSSQVHWLGYCSPNDLAALYSGSSMVVYPSLYEGFGIPLLESMWFEKPVASSNVTSLPEIGGDAVRYFDPENVEAIAEAIEEIATVPSIGADLVRRGRERVTSFTSAAMVSAYLRAFEEVCG